MPTGACGINCDVCRLNIKGVCSTCGPGTSETAAQKLAAQERLLGAPCPVLACARLNGIDYCLRDCQSFACENFTTGPYPFSQGFLQMQERRKQDQMEAYASDGSHLEVADHYWEGVAARDPNTLCNFTFFEPKDKHRWQFDFLNETVQLDLEQRCLLRRKGDVWYKSDDPLLTLVTVIYLYHINGVYPLGSDRIGIQDLKESHFFAGPHELRTQPLLTRFGNDPAGFRCAAKALKGKPLEMADAAYELRPYPRVSICFVLWVEDAEFKPRLQVLLDRSIENYLAADAIWALINRVVMAFCGSQK